MNPKDRPSSDRVDNRATSAKAPPEAPAETRRRTLWSLPSRARKIATILMAVFTIGVLGWMIYSNLEVLKEIHWKLSILPLLASFVTYFIYVGLGSMLWAWLMGALGSPASWWEHIRIYYISTLGSRTPIPLGYVASRLVLYDERTSRTTISIASGIELVLLMLSGFALGLTLGSPLASNLSYGSLVLVLVMGLILAHPRVLNFLLLKLRLEGARRLQYKDLLIFFLAGLLVWVAGGLVLYFLIASIYSVPTSSIPQVIGAWSLSGMVAILMTFFPFGLGLREITLGVLLTSSIPTGVAALVAILSRVALTLYDLILAGLASLIKK